MDRHDKFTHPRLRRSPLLKLTPFAPRCPLSLKRGGRRSRGVSSLLALALLIPALALPQIPTAGLVAHYPFNGNANDESGNGNDGTVYGATPAVDRFGNAGSAYSFDGIDDNINLGSGINLADSSFTFSFWDKEDLLEGIVFSQGYVSNNKRLIIGYYSDYKFGISFYYNDLSTIQAYSDTVNWQHWVCTFNALTKERRIYLNGQLIAEDIASANYSGTGDLYLGSVFNSTGFYSGKIDDIRIYNRALSAAEIQALYQESGWPPTASLANTKIAFGSQRDGDYDIYVMNPDGSNLTNITNTTYNESAPRWSPNGNQIAFTTDRDGNQEIYVMNADGSNPYNLTQNPANEERCSWSPDGSRIAFTTNRDGNSEIYVMKADGSNQTRLTNNTVDDHYLDWSPDGKWIAFSRKTAPGQPISDWQIIIIDVDGTNEYPVTDTNQNTQPAWSPNGTKFVYQSWRGGLSYMDQLWVANFAIVGSIPTLSNDVNITNNSYRQCGPSWSPDGTKLVYHRATTTSHTDYDIWMMDADGGNPIPIANPSGVADTGPDWSPFLFDAPPAAPTGLTATPGDQQITLTWSPNSEADLSHYVVYQSTTSGFTPSSSDSVGRVDKPDTTFTATDLTNGTTYFYRITAVDEAGNESGYSVQVIATPMILASTKIAFASKRDGDWDVYIMNPDGSGVTNITNTSTNESVPRWSPDGSQIAFTSNRDGDYDIHVMNADGTNPRNLTQNPANEEYCAWSPDGKKIAFGTNRDGNSEIYVMNADGSGQTRLTNNTVDDSYPDWSPDGNWIIFSRVTTPELSIGHYQFVIMDANRKNEYPVSDTEDNREPSWSPDGSKIAYISTRNGNAWREQIWVGNFEVTDEVPSLSNDVNITNNEYRHATPRWSPDGKQIVFASSPYNTWNGGIWVMNGDGSNPVQLFDTPGVPDGGADWSPFLGVDTEGPAITNIETTTGPNIGNTITVLATITDLQGLQAVDLHYARGGSAVFTTVPMSFQGNDTELGTIPGSAVTEKGVAYFISAEDNLGNVSRSDTMSIQVGFPSGTLTTSMSGSAFRSGFPKNQWRLISIPGDIDTRSVSRIIETELGSAPSDETWKIFRYTGPGPDDYAAASSFASGESYFLKQVVEETVHFTLSAGRSVDLTGWNLTLPARKWRFVSSPYPFAVSVDADQGTFKGPYTYGAFGSGGQEGWSMAQVQTTFDPWGGYIVYNNTDETQTLELKPASLAKALLAKHVEDELPAGWLLHLTAEGARYFDEGNTIGRIPGASNDRDEFDSPEPPYLEGYISLALDRPDWSANAGMSRFTSDVRTLEETNGLWDLDLRTKGETGPITITYYIQGEVPPGLSGGLSGILTGQTGSQVVLLDLVQRQACDLTAGEPPEAITNYSENLPYRLKVITGTPDYVQGAIEEALAQLPEEFALSQNYPNPFNPSTTIEYALPLPARVSLRVYNLLGREIAALVNDWQDIGYYEIVWQGRDQAGRSVASGVYFAVLQADGHLLTRKMLLLK